MRTRRTLGAWVGWILLSAAASALPVFEEDSSHIDNPYLRYDLLPEIQWFQGWGGAAGRLLILKNEGTELVALTDRTVDPPAVCYVNCLRISMGFQGKEDRWILSLAQDTEDSVYVLMLTTDVDGDGELDLLSYPAQDSPKELPLYMPSRISDRQRLGSFWQGFYREVVSVEEGPITLNTGWGQGTFHNVAVVATVRWEGEETLTSHEMYYPSTATGPEAGGLLRFADPEKESGYDRVPMAGDETERGEVEEAEGISPSAPQSSVEELIYSPPAPTPTPVPQAEEKIEDPWLAAVKCAEEKEYEKAILHLRDCLNEKRTGLEGLRAYQLKAICHGKLGDLTGALAPVMAIVFNYLKKPVEPEPECFEAWRKLLDMKPGTCIELTQAIIEKYKDTPERMEAVEARLLCAFGEMALAWPGYSTSAKERCQRADALVTEAMACVEDPLWKGFMQYLLGFSHLFQGRVSESEDAIAKAYAWESFTPLAFLESYFGKRLAGGPEIAACLCAPLGMLSELLDYAEATRLLKLAEACQDLRQSRDLYVQFSRMSWLAQAEYSPLRHIVLKGWQLQEEPGQIYAEVLREIVQEPVNYFGNQAIQVLEKEARNKKNADAIVACLEEAMREDVWKEGLSHLCLAQGRVWQAAEQPDKALGCYLRLLKEYPMSRSVRAAHWEMSQIFLKRGDVNAALVEWRKTVGDTAEYDEIYVYKQRAAKAIGDHFLSTGQVEKASSWWKHLLDPTVQDPTVTP